MNFFAGFLTFFFFLLNEPREHWKKNSWKNAHQLEAVGNDIIYFVYVEVWRLTIRSLFLLKINFLLRRKTVVISLYALHIKFLIGSPGKCQKCGCKTFSGQGNSWGPGTRCFIYPNCVAEYKVILLARDPLSYKFNYFIAHAAFTPLSPLKANTHVDRLKCPSSLSEDV